MKKLLYTLILIFIFNTTTFANQVDFYGERQGSWNINESILNKNLENFYNETALNTDIIILGKGDSCYLNSNFDSCVQKEKKYSSDLLIVLSMKSDIKSRGDIRSLIKDEFKESITPREFKNLQDNIIYNFKNKNFTKGLNEYLDLLEDLIDSKCKKIGILGNCDAVKLAKNYHKFVADQEYKKKYNAMMKMIYYFISIIGIILSYLGLRKFFIFMINNLYKDVKYKIISIEDYEIFEKDKNDILEKFKILFSNIKIKLGDLDKNVFSIGKYYFSKKNEFNILNKELLNMQKAFSKKEKLKEKVGEFKNINL